MNIDVSAAGDRMNVTAHWCPEHREPLTNAIAKVNDWYCPFKGCERDLETVECDLVPTDQLAGAVEALREAGSLAKNVRAGWDKTLPRDVKDCLRRIEDLARLGGR
jgi:hypothetical protein